MLAWLVLILQVFGGGVGTGWHDCILPAGNNGQFSRRGERWKNSLVVIQIYFYRRIFSIRRREHANNKMVSNVLALSIRKRQLRFRVNVMWKVDLKNWTSTGHAEARGISVFIVLEWTNVKGYWEKRKTTICVVHRVVASNRSRSLMRRPMDLASSQTLQNRMTFSNNSQHVLSSLPVLPAICRIPSFWTEAIMTLHNFLSFASPLYRFVFLLSFRIPVLTTIYESFLVMSCFPLSVLPSVGHVRA